MISIPIEKVPRRGNRQNAQKERSVCCRVTGQNKPICCIVCPVFQRDSMALHSGNGPAKKMRGFNSFAGNDLRCFARAVLFGGIIFAPLVSKLVFVSPTANQRQVSNEINYFKCFRHGYQSRTFQMPCRMDIFARPHESTYRCSAISI